MASHCIEIMVCQNCGTRCRVIYHSGIDPMRSTEIGYCPNCGTEIVRKNITGDIEVELIEGNKLICNYDKKIQL